MEPEEEKEPPPFPDDTEWLRESMWATRKREMWGSIKLAHLIDMSEAEMALKLPIFAKLRLMETEEAEVAAARLNGLAPKEARQRLLEMFDEARPGFTWEDVDPLAQPDRTYCDFYCIRQIANAIGAVEEEIYLRDVGVGSKLLTLRGLQLIVALNEVRELPPEEALAKFERIFDRLSTRVPIKEWSRTRSLLRTDLTREGIEADLGIERDASGEGDEFSKYLELMTQEELVVVRNETKGRRPEDARQRFLEVMGELFPDGLRR